jgi:hypothetical protein
MIRVFPYRTKWTPDDDMAFVGDPELFRPPGDYKVAISCVFTWHIDECERLRRSWGRFYKVVEVGGPAYDDPGGDFVPGRFVKIGKVHTSRGCTKDCSWCLVPKREGWIREIEIKQGWNVCDNNLLACSEKHIADVFSMLRVQKEPVVFSGGLDAELFQKDHAALLKTIRWKQAFFACDYPGAVKNITRVGRYLSDIPRNKKRCYVLIGFNGETTQQAQKRLEAVWDSGFLPFAMLYRPSSEISKVTHTNEWRTLQRNFSRPAITKAIMNATS